MINFTVLKDLSRPKKYLKNSMLATDNAGTELFVILMGEVGIFIENQAHGRELVATLGPGEFFGESSLFLEKSEPIAAMALTDVITLPIGRSDAPAIFRDEPDLALEITRAVCERLERVRADYEKLAGRPWAPGGPLPKQPSAAAPAPQAPAARVTRPASPAPAPAQAATAEARAPGAIPVFPEGHGSYTLPLDGEDPDCLMDKGYTCPVCKKEFKVRAVRSSRLVMDRTDSDMRQRYKGVEPLYYDVVTCPHCLYSALGEQFNAPDSKKPALIEELQPHKAWAGPIFAAEKGANAVFASYYLALLCAPKCFARHHLASAKLLLKLSRVYQDCGDERMGLETAKRALDEYLYVYLNEQGDPSMDQQLSIIIGELSLKLGDLKNAREHFLKARMVKDGSPLIKAQAEARLMDIRGERHEPN